MNRRGAEAQRTRRSRYVAMHQESSRTLIGDLGSRIRSCSSAALRLCAFATLRFQVDVAFDEPAGRLRRHRRVRAGHRAVRALLDPRGALVPGARAEGSDRARRHRQGADRRAVRVELHAHARHRGGPDAAPGADAALAGPHPHGRRLGRGGAAPRGARGAKRRRPDRRVHRRRHQSRRLVPAHAGKLQPVRARCGVPLRRRRTQRELRLPDLLLHAHLRRHARGLRQAVRRPARQRAALPACAVQEAADAAGVPRRAPDHRAAAPVRLRHAVRGRGRLFWS